MHLGLLAAIVVGGGLYRLSRRRRPEHPYLHTWVIDSLRWFLPIVHWFERNRSLVQVVELLRMSLNAGCPVNEAIRGTLQLDVNVFFRTRLVCWLRRVERGENIAGSARRCGLGAALAWAFEGPAQTGNTPAVLEMLESHYRFNYSYRVNLTRFILWPLGIIALGATVGFIVYSIFSPAVMVLRSLAGSIYP
jgi:type II secretory pathway component PulF